MLIKKLNTITAMIETFANSPDDLIRIKGRDGSTLDISHSINGKWNIRTSKKMSITVDASNSIEISEVKD